MYEEIFWVAECEFKLKKAKFKMVDSIWRSQILNWSFWNFYSEFLFRNPKKSSGTDFHLNPSILDSFKNLGPRIESAILHFAILTLNRIRDPKKFLVRIYFYALPRIFEVELFDRFVLSYEQIIKENLFSYVLRRAARWYCDEAKQS